jgi:hypothetical protein
MIIDMNAKIRVAIGKKEGKTVYDNFYIIELIPCPKKYKPRCIIRSESWEAGDPHIPPLEIEIPQEWIPSCIHKFEIWEKYGPSNSEYIGDRAGMVPAKFPHYYHITKRGNLI